MDEIEALMNKAYQRLHAAHELFNHGFYDDSVNRSYYAMVAQQWLHSDFGMLQQKPIADFNRSSQNCS